MPVYKRTKMCAECPFRADAPRGWLGPLTVEDLLKTVHGPTKIGSSYVGDIGDLVCHMDLAHLPKNLTPDQILEQGQMCVGMVRYANSIIKRAHRPDLAEFQDRLCQVKDDPTIPPGKLAEYHTLSMATKKASRVTLKPPSRVTFSQTGSVKDQEFDIKINGTYVGKLARLSKTQYYYYATVGEAKVNTHGQPQGLEDCKASAKKFCKTNFKG